MAKVTFLKLTQNWLRKTNLSLILVKNGLETRENEQNVVLNESSEALGNRSEIVRILVLAMTTADDGVGGSNPV